MLKILTNQQRLNFSTNSLNLDIGLYSSGNIKGESQNAFFKKKSKCAACVNGRKKVVKPTNKKS